MNFVADEGIDKQIVERLRQDGHEILYVAEMEPSISDEEVLNRANEKGALLITTDKEFGEMVFHQNLLTIGGVILLRLLGLSPGQKSEIVSKVIESRSPNLPKAFSVISPGRVRIRQRS
jgi:predicted nuclease of predicted toxin-antitoxin system